MLKRRFFLIAIIACIALIICDPNTAVCGARDGIELSIHSVVPSLFPFIFLTSIISCNSELLQTPILRPLSKWTGVPAGCESIVLLGWLGGYPIGAKCVYDNYKNGQLNKKTAARMLGFCNNAGPSFIFGILSFVFSDRSLLWILWITQILSSLLVGILLPGKQNDISVKPALHRTTIVQTLSTSIHTMATICGWIILFRIGFIYADKWLFCHLSTTVTVLITGVLELTNGCFSLSTIANEADRFIVCNIMLTFGGLCVALQSKSVVKDLNFANYFPGKLLQCLFSLLLSFLFVLIYF